MRGILFLVIIFWPKYQIDHIDSNRDNNRWDNLREATNQENTKNRCLPITNTSGRIGVYWHKPCGKWQARITGNGKNLHLGLFDNFEDAVYAREQAEVKYDYHPNHGKIKGAI